MNWQLQALYLGALAIVGVGAYALLGGVNTTREEVSKTEISSQEQPPVEG